MQSETPNTSGSLLPRSTGEPESVITAVVAFPSRRELRHTREATKGISPVRMPRAPRTRPLRPGRRSLRQRLTGGAAMLLIGGILASLTLPAYALPSAGDRAAVVQDAAAQQLSVNRATVTASARDGYGATSATALRAISVAALRQKYISASPRTTARAPGDDYPWFNQPTAEQGGGLSPMRYNYRECVDFVAWRLNQDAGSASAPFKYTWATMTPGNGSASGWRAAWIANGWPTSTTPVAGSVAWFPFNHASYVKSVLPGGNVLLEEYNFNNDHRYGQRIIPASAVTLFLYPPPR